MAGVASTNKGVAPGGLICVTNGPGQTATRTALTINKCDPADWNGSVELLWTAGNIKVYNAATGGDEVTSGKTFANAALPTSLWVEGTAPSATAGDVVFRLNPVGIDCPQAGVGCDRVVMTVIAVDLEIYKPKVVNPAEPMIPEADKLTNGSVTFVNLDNDDNDSKFDHGGATTDDEVVGGDDEFVKIKLKIKPIGLTNGHVKLLTTAGADNIVVWTNNTKAAASAYALGTVLNVPGGFTVEGGSLTKTMWVEGVLAHTAQQGTKLKMTYAINGAEYGDEASLTVVGVQKVEWQGKGNSLNDDDKLTEDTNWPTGLAPGAVRVFPGARMEGGSVGPARDKVNVVVSLTVAPPHPIKLYVRSFDVDDPTADSNPVDNESNAEDNRGEAGGRKSGQFTGGGADGIVELQFDENVLTTNCEFQVTMQPGDNFRVAANGDKDFLLGLENDDLKQNVGVSAAETNANKQLICHMKVTGTPAEREIRLSVNYASKVLTVWRFLHVEVDSMAAPGPNDNIVSGNLTGVVGNGTVAQRVNLSVNLKTGLTPQDNSTNLDSIVAYNGRFENGWIMIGTGYGTPGQKQTKALLGNGNTYVRKDAGIDIPALVSKPGQTNVSGKVIAWSGKAFTLSVSSGTLSTNYNGGSLNVAGVSATITTVSGANVINVSVAPTIPFVLYDDDDDTRLPSTLPTTMMNQAFLKAYYMPLIDGGNNITNNQVGANASVPFRPNATAVQLHAIMQRDSTAYETDAFWVVYVCSAWQYTPDRDSDPNSERGVGGVCLCIVDNDRVARGGDASWVFVETCGDRMLNGSPVADEGLTERVVVHEIGHQLGLAHLPGTIMHESQQRVPSYTGFGDIHLHLLRSRIKSPGE